MKPLIWIIDEEWSNYDIEENLLRQNFPDCMIKHSKNNYHKDLNEFGQYADAILCQIYVNITNETIEALKNCKVISIYGGGYDRVDINAAKSKDIKVTFVPGYCVEDVSDYVIACIYYFNKQLNNTAFNSLEKGQWGAQAITHLNRRIKNSTLFIIGFGRIGRLVAKKANSLDLNVIVYDPYVSNNIIKEYNVKRVDLEVGLKNADYISINTRYYEETKALISMKEFKLMKNTAIIINTSRGGVIVQDDLIQAVENGTIAGAALDVVENEPPKIGEGIFKCKNILVTPHISYLSKESIEELKIRAVNNVVKALKGEQIEDLVK
ncbi:C-terminal binding protein [Thermoanaerobacterium sp. RBIITD]|uniref:C-terminal binding protein n=1 Tax=Thermoanaerobacterium sp. RBIITD TaxID=1550240 RepID=UPI000BB90E0D|nr:C-terminal binding protein [Thermoanaerobacterium sp. RBIITD]SNX54280.1 D-3-phosphoglycerate dehydrogenase [Thermoanaerobacterium sp. RBIITD]